MFLGFFRRFRSSVCLRVRDVSKFSFRGQFVS